MTTLSLLAFQTFFLNSHPAFAGRQTRNSTRGSEAKKADKYPQVRTIFSIWKFHLLGQN